MKRKSLVLMSALIISCTAFASEFTVQADELKHNEPDYYKQALCYSRKCNTLCNTLL